MKRALIPRSNYKRPKTVTSSALKNAVWEKTNGKCIYCGCRLRPFGNDSPQSFNVEHVVALSKGGEHVIENLVPSCRTCNGKKGAK